MSINIQQASTKDLSAIQELNEQLFLYEKQFTQTYNEKWMYQEKGVEYFNKRLTNQDGLSICLLATIDPQPIGYICGYVGQYSFRNINPIAEIENMFVVKEHRFKSVGTQLVQAFLKQAKALGAKRVKVGTYPTNQIAVDFYHKQAFHDHELVLEMDLSGDF